MNQTLRRNHMRRCAFRKRGGGFSNPASLVAVPASDWTFASKALEVSPYSDCDVTMRPGQLVNEPNPALAQAAMAGGRRRSAVSRKMATGGRRTVRRSRSTASRKTAAGRRRQRGGAGGFAVNPALSVGGFGPVAAPVYSAVPCDARAGAPNGLNPVGFSPDAHAPADLYSLTPNQSGGAYSSGNAYAPACYQAPGSQLPVYEASSAGFTFRPSTEVSGTLPDGVTAYMDVKPMNARVGGGRRRSRRAQKKHKNTRRRN